jgi:hypothetical protein
MVSIVGASTARPYMPGVQKLRSEAQRRRWTFYETIKSGISRRCVQWHDVRTLDSRKWEVTKLRDLCFWLTKSQE